MHAVIGLFVNRAEAESAVERLVEIDVDRGEIGVAMKDERELAVVRQSTGATAGDLAGEGATAGFVSGAGVGVLVGLALAGSALVLPGIGPLVIAGPLAAAVTGASIGALSGGVVGGLIGMGIPEDDAKAYSVGLGEGHIILTARVPKDEANAVRKIFDEEGSIRTTMV
jgi:hypothetical protein